MPEIDQNGNIVVYEVRYDPLETFGGQIATGYENTTSGSQLMITLEDLQEYVEYNISVRAYTAVGPGPFSIGMLQITMEARKLYQLYTVCIQIFTMQRELVTIFTIEPRTMKFTHENLYVH